MKLVLLPLINYLSPVAVLNGLQFKWSNVVWQQKEPFWMAIWHILQRFWGLWTDPSASAVLQRSRSIAKLPPVRCCRKKKKEKKIRDAVSSSLMMQQKKKNKGFGFSWDVCLYKCAMRHRGCWKLRLKMNNACQKQRRLCTKWMDFCLTCWAPYLSF